MEHDRIYFPGNPWPEGHPVERFRWSAVETDGDVWFGIHLKSARYYSERRVHEDEDDLSAWASPTLWNNYHSCTISTSEWHGGGFRVCEAAEFSPEFLDGLELLVDPNPETVEDWEDLAFQSYVLGHDNVAKHKIRFERIGDSKRFKIIWVGAHAQSYFGDDEFTQEFSVSMSSLEFPELNCSSSYRSSNLENASGMVCSHVLDEQAPILYVSRDKNEGMWRFLCGPEDHKAEQSREITLGEAARIDASLNALDEMSPGIGAARESATDEWTPFIL
ncbi:hypothetical protein [Allohahella sp. A8]|uniref:hypothetical protein n=1 Tax=Allohahella sp. A8 TaxID=3141461 RepID=UPI003A809B10